MLNRFGIDHDRFTYKYQGLDQKFTGVEKAGVVKAVLADGGAPPPPSAA
ncbi:MAG: hypothetical protein KIT09_28875 [Bryobacteraceae bacterium]|nr:hypothetical protein [Bryobacteraceae bacterium]